MKKEIDTKTVFPAVDFHSHILPGMDDGSASPEESEQMLLQSREQGVEILVLSPHFYPDREPPEHFLKRREEAWNRLLTVYDPKKHPKLYLGAEVAYFQGLGRCEQIKQLAIGTSRLLLVEMPFSKWNRSVEDDISLLQRQMNLTPVIAHIERYAKGNTKLIESFLNSGILIQSNAEFFFNKKINRKAIKMFCKGQIQLLGSDSHNLTTRAPNIASATGALAAALDPELPKQIFKFSKKLLGEI